MAKQKGIKVAISVDWDFFIDTDQFDMGHKENKFFIETLWQIRAIEQGLMDQFKLADHLKIFWPFIKELSIYPPALFATESHLHAYAFYSGFVPDLLINFDSHHDLFKIKEEKMITCENWALEYLRNFPTVQYIWVYPKWVKKNDIKLPFGIMNRVKTCSFESLPMILPDEHWLPMMGHVCRSGAWMPPWLDGDFDKFLEDSHLQILKFEQFGPPEKRNFIKPTEEEIKKDQERMEKAFGKKVDFG